MAKAKPPPNFSFPDDLPGKILDAGLEPAHVGLVALAWSESSRYLLDGRIARSRLRGRGLTKRRESDLIGLGGVFEANGTDIILVDYLKYNKTRAEIEALREARAAAGAIGGATTAAIMPRVNGQFSNACPYHGTAWRTSKYAGAKLYCPEYAAPGGPSRRGGRCGATPSAPPNATPSARIADDAAQNSCRLAGAATST